MKFQPGQSGNLNGRPRGSSRLAEYREMLDPSVPDILKAIVERAKDGDLRAAQLILDRVYPARDAALSDLQEEINEVRDLINRRAIA